MNSSGIPLTTVSSTVTLLPISEKEIEGVETLADFIALQNKYAALDNVNLISQMSGSKLKKLLKHSDALHEFLNCAKLNAVTFSTLLDKLTYEHLKQMIGNTTYAWEYFLDKLSSAFVAILLFQDDRFLNEVLNCYHLGQILRSLDQQEHPKLYEKLGTRLPNVIVQNLVDIRGIPKEFQLQLFQHLGYQYISSLVSCADHLLVSLPVLPKQARLSFLKLVGFEKVRSFIFDESDVQKLLAMMPINTHDFLKKILFLYAIKINCIGSKSNLTLPVQEVKDVDLSGSYTSYSHIQNPIQITEHIVIGKAWRKNSMCKDLAVFKIMQGQVVEVIDVMADIAMDALKLIDKDKKIFLVKESETNRYHEVIWIDGKLKRTKTASAQWHLSFSRNDTELFKDMVPLADGTWMILSQERTRVINKIKGWYIDILDPKTFTLSRKLNVDCNQYKSVDRLALLPDGKTILAWDGYSEVEVKCSSGAFSSNVYSICLINVSDYAAQCFILPIDPKETPGKIKQINVQDNRIEIEISVKVDRNTSSSKYYSFSYQSLNLEIDRRNTLFGNSSKDDTSLIMRKDPDPRLQLRRKSD